MQANKSNKVADPNNRVQIRATGDTEEEIISSA